MVDAGVPPPLWLLGVPIHPLRPAQLVEAIVAFGRGDRLRRVYNVNVHAMNLAHDDPEFAGYLRGADLVFCDGYGVKWGARLAGLSIPDRMTPPDWIDDFAAATARAKQRVFAVGDVEGVAASFQTLLGDRHPGYLSAGAHHGFFAKEGPENDAVIAAINQSRATHLLVGLGMPTQERWIERNADRLDVKVVIPVGALFRWVIGHERRAPRWMTSSGLEWAARLGRHPIRHFRRYVIGNPRFLVRLVRSRLALK
jgi:N-acetylglucosaminyldiphosphoundecaprenol N-acetyl-beta-D-mannosaminyltransferase